MSYFADSAWEYIKSKVDRVTPEDASGPGRKLLVMAPAMVEDATLDLAETFTRQCAADTRLELTLKIAQVVTAEWSEAGRTRAATHDWLDDRGNLTYYRSNTPSAPGKLHLVVLCGADRVTDAGSLEDFHLCDMETLWREHMRGSFSSWVQRKLDTAAVAVGARTPPKDFDRLLTPLLDHGRADLYQIGCWLAALDLSAADNVREAQKAMLSQYDAFGLPSFIGFPLEKKSATLAPYIEKANAFFAYTLYLEPRVRDKAAKVVKQILDDPDEEHSADLLQKLEPEAVRGPYNSGQAFLEGLLNYIQTEDVADRERLRECDFVTIMDVVLKFRRKREKPKRASLRKLSGSPVETVLHALWQTLREFGKDGRFRDAQVRRIEVVAERYKHDYERPDEDDASDRTDFARQNLVRLLGGVDELVRERAEFPAANGQDVPVACHLADSEVPCVYSKTAEPQLEFAVELLHDADEDPYRQRFAWRLPEIQSYRLAQSLIRWAQESLAKSPAMWNLPVFHLPYYEELLRATDDEETRRVMLHSVQSAHPCETRWTNLLGPEWLDTGDALETHLKNLALAYGGFITAAFDRGLHAALFSGEWYGLRTAYSDACKAALGFSDAGQSQMTPMLMRCFLVVAQRASHLGSAWCAEPFERSGIATVLHPAVLEMLEAQIVYLFTCFRAGVAEEWQRDERRKAFSEKIWNGYVDLASIQCPVAGLLCNADLNLDTTVRGQGLIHRIGSPEASHATLSTRLLLRYEDADNEEAITDTEMLRETRESKLLFRLLMDYFRLHPHARDGLALAVFRNEDIQPVVAAVHQYLNRLADERDPRYYVLSPIRQKPYAISVILFSESGDDVDVTRWIEQWRERWEAGETESRFEAYRRCRFSVAHRIVDARQLGSFQRLIDDGFQADIAVLYDFIGAGQGGNRFAQVDQFDITTRLLKFPILEKACCAVRHPTDSGKRSRVISNHQFSLSALHTQIMHRLKSPGGQPGSEFVVLGLGDFSPWQGVIDALHGKVEWVICIDPSIDERLIAAPAGTREHEREIIGFGSGVGSHGEANYTISTEQFSLADVCVRLSESIQGLFASRRWSAEQCQCMAKSVLREARELSGLSLVRATGVGDYVREFMAYALIRKMLRERRPVLCDHLVSLDAYRHWFDFAESESRPDLMWLTAWVNEEQRVCLDVRLLECKLAHESEEYVVKARGQVNNGLRVLVPAFAPAAPGDAMTEQDRRPDQRYWWLQLHRLIASRAEIESRDQARVLSALERLAEGDYEISWGAAVFAFWSDSHAGIPERIGQWTTGNNGDITASVYAMGSEFVRQLTLEQTDYPVPWAEWDAKARAGASNVYEALEDIEYPASADDDEDTPAWHEETGGDDERDDGAGIADESPQDVAFEPAAGASIAPDKSPAAPPPVGTEPGLPRQQPVPAPSSNTRADGAEDPGPGVEAAQSIPQRVPLGTTVRGGKTVYWEFGHSQLANRHMVVFGTSGMGKTYAIQCLLCELGRQHQNSLIIDYTDGFVPSKLEPPVEASLGPRQHFIQQAPLPINPFKTQVTYEAGIEFSDTPMAIAKRVASVFKSVYALGDQQFPVLIDAITDGIKRFGDNFNLRRLLEMLHESVENTVHAKTTVRTTASKLKPFIESNPFASDAKEIGWHEIFSDADQRCHVFQFFRVDKDSARALIEFVLWDLYSFVSSAGDKDIPRVVVLDEVQNLDLGPEAPVAKYLTEGRKRGLALIAATQTVKGVGGVTDARLSRLFQAEHKLFFKPTENEIREHAQLLNNAISTVSVGDWAERLASLNKGECWSLGRHLNTATGQLIFQAHRIKITSLEERGFSV